MSCLCHFLGTAQHAKPQALQKIMFLRPHSAALEPLWCAIIPMAPVTHCLKWPNIGPFWRPSRLFWTALRCPAKSLSFSGFYANPHKKLRRCLGATKLFIQRALFLTPRPSWPRTCVPCSHSKAPAAAEPCSAQKGVSRGSEGES